MSFIVDQNLCVECGACTSNCPNKAIIRRGNGYLVTELCCDCGTCIHCCPVGAMGQGKTRADFDNRRINEALKDKLSLKRDIVAMKYADKAPPGVPVEEGPHFWCAICGDIFEGNGKPVFFTGRSSACGGSTMVGIGTPKATKEEFTTVINEIVVGEGKLYATNDLLSKGREEFPQFPKIYGGVTIGSLEHVEMPDLILFPVNGHQMCIIATAYAFDTGKVVTGYAAAPACVMTLTFPFVENKPVFAIGDWGGRTRSRIKDEEIFVCVPYKLSSGLVKNMERTIYAQESSEFV